MVVIKKLLGDINSTKGKSGGVGFSIKPKLSVKTKSGKEKRGEKERKLEKEKSRLVL